MHWIPTPAKTRDVPFTQILSLIQNPVPGMWLILSHINRRFSSWIRQRVSFPLSPYMTDFSLENYVLVIWKRTYQPQSFLMTVQTPKPKEWKTWRRPTVLRPLQQRRKTLHEMPEQPSRREPRAPKRRFCPLCPWSVWDLPACFTLWNANSGASDTVQNFDCDRQWSV